MASLFCTPLGVRKDLYKSSNYVRFPPAFGILWRKAAYVCTRFYLCKLLHRPAGGMGGQAREAGIARAANAAAPRKKAASASASAGSPPNRCRTAAPRTIAEIGRAACWESVSTYG